MWGSCQFSIDSARDGVCGWGRHSSCKQYLAIFRRPERWNGLFLNNGSIPLYIRPIYIYIYIHTYIPFSHGRNSQTGRIFPRKHRWMPGQGADPAVDDSLPAAVGNVMPETWKTSQNLESLKNLMVFRITFPPEIGTSCHHVITPF